MKKQTIPSGKIDLVGLKKVGIGALIAGGGAILTYLATAIPGVDFGIWTPVAVGLASIVINFLRKLLQKYEA